MEKKRAKKLTLRELLVHKKMMICILNGFTSGMPIYFLIQLIPAWLRTQEIDLKTIGFFGLVTLPYSFKYLWAPTLDRYVPPFLGRRRGWMLISQIAIAIFMVVLGLFEPKVDIELIIYVAFIIGFFGATQDIVLDAYRRELLDDDELGLGNAYYANAYRISGFVPGGLGLIMAEHIAWPVVFFVIAAFMAVGIFQTLWIKEIDSGIIAPKTLKEAVVEPFKEFFKRDGVKSGLLILAFIFFYKFGDVMATSLITPFYLDVGFSTDIIGSVVKVVGLWSMIIGGTLGGMFMFKVGINKSLWLFGFVQMLSILGFAALNEIGPNEVALSVVVAFEYLGVGLGSAALMAYIAKCTNKNFTGTQLALLTSLFSIPKSFTGILSGILIEGVKPEDGLFYQILGSTEAIGYTNFFIVCTVMAVPGMLLLFWVAPWRAKVV